MFRILHRPNQSLASHGIVNAVFGHELGGRALLGRRMWKLGTGGGLEVGECPRACLGFLRGGVSLSG